MKTKLTAKKVFLLSWLIVLALPFLFHGKDNSVLAQAKRQARAPIIMMVPFQINAGAEFENLDMEIPNMLEERLAMKGFKVIPVGTTVELLQKMNIKSLDINTVKRLANQAKADAAVYGSFSAIGSNFSIDARLVSANPNINSKPLFVERSGDKNVLNAVDELSGKVMSTLVSKETIAGVEVRGTKAIDPEVVLMRINSRRGDAVDPAAIDREVKKIWDLGYFSDVSVNIESRSDGHYLVYTVKEKPRLESINITGTSEIDQEDVSSAMTSRQGSVLNDKVLADDLRKIRELYHKKGFYLVEIKQSMQDTKDGGVILNLAITEGKRLYIKEIKIEGAKEMSEGDIKSELALSERSIISWITGTGILKEEMLERDSSAIGSFYLDHGFLDVIVKPATVEYKEDGIIVTFTVIEGSRYKLGDIKFAGDLIDTDEKIRSILTLDKMAKDKDYFNLSVMQEDSKKISDLYADYGYAFAEAYGSPKPRGEEHIVDVTYHITKNNKVYVRRVVLDGNTRTRDNVILREMRLTDDSQFSGKELRRSMDRLNNLGFFEIAESEIIPTGNPNEVDLKVKVKEKPTGALIGGVGYSTFSSFGVSATIMERNLWGKGYALSLQALFSGRRSAYTANFVNPRLYDTEIGMSLAGYKSRDDFYDYKKDTTGAGITFMRPIGEYSAVSIGYRLDQYRIFEVEDDSSWLIRKYKGNNIASVGSIGFARDTTNKMNPTTGTINSVSLDYGGGFLGGSDDFIGVRAENQIYYKLAERHLLHSKLQGRALFKNGNEEVPIFERFWMGGIDTVRGYNARDIIPVDPKTGDYLGGTRMAVLNLEYIWRLSTELGVNLVPFFDMGVNYADDIDDFSWNNELKKSTGLELRWRSPMGDLRFSYGIPLDENRDGSRSSGRFEFSMGQFF
ncbi:outer membrane protein assembly factor BamA [Desulfovibrio litoralis]|uniref:Outer membrane protein assembly factor BamA n=1 Tax=Desulfovibrio litoralis DSM 11393 TaxID=1121455 RepID=A0A1M7TN60_9BACT|nr:outer membrane protein assembly factor BamA [Desulfovibrio litoralis]SHN72116.1 Beta-barrel assembly machine subunit BamA [Desulfovibrio litoralis DSM 11393]